MNTRTELMCWMWACCREVWVVQWMGGGFKRVIEVGASCIWEGGEDGGCIAWEVDGVYGWEDEVFEGGFEVKG